MYSKIWKSLAAVIGAGVALSAQALTYQPMLDEDLLAQSPVVVRGEILSGGSTGTGDAVPTQYRVALDQVYKGQVPVSEISVVTAGGDGTRRVPGLPVFGVGDQVVLFLQESGDGRYRLMQSALGAFVAQLDALGRLVYRRQLGGSRAVPQDAPRRGAVHEVPRLAGEFLRFLGDSEPEYAASSLGGNLLGGGRSEQDEFNTLGTPPSRWWEFDNGIAVTLRAHVSGQSGMPGGGFTEFQSGIAAWNNDSGSNIRYLYNGTTTASGGLDRPDNVNAILFDDPNNEMAGSFDCQSGGVLAIGGFVTSGDTRTFRGQIFDEIVEGDIVTNDGTGCFFRRDNNTHGEEVFGHEVGHTLGLAHSCEESGGLIIGLPLGGNSCGTATAEERDALMRATPHADGRGADLRADDRAGAEFLYPTQNNGTEPEPDSEPDDSSAGSEPDTTDNDGNESGGTGGGSGDSSSGGGCRLAAGGTFDPLLPLLLISAAALAFRHRRRSLKPIASGLCD